MFRSKVVTLGRGFLQPVSLRTSEQLRVSDERMFQFNYYMVFSSHNLDHLRYQKTLSANVG